MSIFGTLFSGGANNLVKTVGEAIDSVVTSDQERLELENELHRAEMEHKAEMRSLDVQETGKFLADLGSARDHQTHVQESKSAGWLAKNIQPLLAIFVIGLTFFMFGRALFGTFEINTHASTITTMILGALVGVATQVVSYYFGSSRESESSLRKTTHLLGASRKR